MRARTAYISSLGTGGILVASALLMLAMISALVAFHAWPAENTAGGSVSAIPTSPAGSTPFVHDTASVFRPPRAAVHAARARTAHQRAASVSTVGLRKVPAAAGQLTSHRAVGVFKVPSAVVPATPPGPHPARPTGPRRRLPPHTQPCACAPHPKPPLHLPNAPLPGDVDSTTTGVVDSLPPVPDDQNTSSPVPLPLDTVTATVTDLTR